MGRRILRDPTLKLIAQDMVRAGVGEAYWGATLSMLPADKAYTRFLLAWIEDISDHVAEGRGLLVFGHFGSGKTCVTVCLMKQVIAREGTAVKVAAVDLVKYSIEDPPFDRDYTWMDRIREVDLLVIDDLGAEHQSEYAKATVEKIIRGRLEAMRSTVISTNLDPKMLAGVLGEATVNAMKETIYPVEIAGVDWRSLKGRALADSMGKYKLEKTA